MFDSYTVDPSKSSSIFDNFTVEPAPVDPKKQDEAIDIDNYEPEKPEPPKPEEKKSNFWEKIASDIKKGAQSVVDFLAKPEVAQFMKVANIVFAGAMVVAAGALFVTGVGAPAAVAALALAGGAGLAMQLPGVSEKIEAGIVAVIAPIIGQENAEKLGPLLTQGMISGLMVAMVVTGGSADSAKAALDAVVGVFNTMKDVFNGIAQVYQNGGPVLEMLGINVDAQSVQALAGVFGMLGSMMPDMAKFAEGLGESLKSFLANPDMDAFKNFLGTIKELPESIANLMDADLLKGLGALLESGEKFVTDFKTNDFLTNLVGILQILSQGSNLVKA